MSVTGKKKMLIIVSIIGGVLVVAAGVALNAMVFYRPNPSLPNNEIKVGDAIFTVEIASSSIEKARGLSFRESLAEENGMLFLFNKPSIQNFWMKDMHFSLDIIWIGGDTVLGFEENVPSQAGVSIWNLKNYISPKGTNKVLEVNAGMVAKHNIEVGDRVIYGR